MTYAFFFPYLQNQEASTSSQAATTSKDIVSALEGNLSSLQDTDIHAPELYSALVSGSLFDAEEDLLPAREPSLDSSAPVGTTDDSLTRINDDVSTL